MRRCRRALRWQRPITAEVVAWNRGGIMLDVFGAPGFVPRSELAPADRARYRELVGTQWRGYLVAITPRQVIAAAQPPWARRLRNMRRSRFVKGLSCGQERTGVVYELTRLGAFVELHRSGVYGVISRSDLDRQVSAGLPLPRAGERVAVRVKAMSLSPRPLGMTMHIDLTPVPAGGSLGSDGATGPRRRSATRCARS
jgi:ribosomal protein S1